MNALSPIEEFQSLRRYSRDGKRAPYKPILLLIAISKYCEGVTDLVFDEIEELFVEINLSYGLFGDRPPLEQPFGRLSNDGGIWSLRHPDPTRLLGNGRNLLVSALRRERVAAGFTPRMLERFAADPDLIHNVTDLLLASNFPASLHEEIRDRLGLPGSLAEEPRRRSAAFSRSVLDAWFGACAACGHDLRLHRDPVGLDAAHIRWHAMSGPDDVSNGLALCTLHHRLFDRGALTVDFDHRFRVSPHLQGASARRFRQEFEGRPLELPADPRHTPRGEYLAWHHSQVFRGRI